MDRSTAARGLCLLLVMSAAAGLCGAQERKCREVAFPERVQVNGTDLTLNGLGVRKATFLKINVYVAALYVTKPTREATPLINSDAAQQLIVHFVRDVGADDLRKAFREALERQGVDKVPSMKDRLARLNSWMTDMKKGERLMFVRQPHSGVQVTVNGAHKGSIEGDDFARAFVSIWLGPTPPNPEVKSGLLGGECG